MVILHSFSIIPIKYQIVIYSHEFTMDQLGEIYPIHLKLDSPYEMQLEKVKAVRV